MSLRCHETYDFPSFLWCCDAALTDRAETVTIRFRANSSGVPLKVKAICLPFVLVKHPVRGVYSLDVRRYQLVRLDRDYASVAWCSLKSRDQNRKHKKKRKQKIELAQLHPLPACLHSLLPDFCSSLHVGKNVKWRAKFVAEPLFS